MSGPSRSPSGLYGDDGDPGVGVSGLDASFHLESPDIGMHDATLLLGADVGDLELGIDADHDAAGDLDAEGDDDTHLHSMGGGGHAHHPSIAGSGRRRDASRRNVARACERCRSRKSKCSGDIPACALCLRLGKECIYSTAADGRLTDRTAKRTIQALQERVRALESELSAAHAAASAAAAGAPQDIGGWERHSTGPSNPSTNPPTASSGNAPTASMHDMERVDEDDPSCQPFGTGRLVLSPTGNLHLYPAATFYSPAHLAPDWQKALDALLQPVARPGYLAPYLPFPLAKEHHSLLIDLCFTHHLSFGLNSMRDKFIAEMERDPMAKGIYFSPMMHLSVLAVGWRYIRDAGIIRMYHQSENASERGDAFADKALKLMVDEVHDPRLSTIIGLIVLSVYHTGTLRDPIACSTFSCLAQDCEFYLSTALTAVRTHRRCDAALAELGLGVDSDLDIARRDVHGAIMNLSAWWSTYMGQDPLPLRDHADQRMPYIRLEMDGVERDISEIFHHHVQLSDYGLQAQQCNHTMRAPLARRVERVRLLHARLVQWRENLPIHLQWPPRTGYALHPSVVTTHGMYATYIIILFRPYVLELGERSGIHDLALRECLGAAAEIIAQSRYISAGGCVAAAPLSWQHILYVCGTMLVLQASGLPSVPDETRAQALIDLAFLQASLDEIAAVWPVANHTGGSLKQLLQAAHQ